MDQDKPTKPRGFAAMDREKQREIARRGGRAAHQQGTAHQFSSEEARVAGKKGGRSVSQDRRHMSEIGRRGGSSRSARAKAASAAKTTAISQPATTQPSAAQDSSQQASLPPAA